MEKNNYLIDDMLFNEAILYAREMYIGLTVYYQRIINDCASIKKKKYNIYL